MAILLFIPAHIFMLIYTKTLKDFMTRKATYFSLFVFMFIAGFLIISRQQADKEFLHNLIGIDAHRFNGVVDNNEQPFDFYFNNFNESRFSIWSAMFVISIVLFILVKKEKGQNVILMWAISLFISQFALISIAVTKFYWYDLPLYPYMAIITGFGISFISTNIKSIVISEGYKPLFYITIFCVPLYFSMKHSHDNNISESDRKAERISEYLHP